MRARAAVRATCKEQRAKRTPSAALSRQGAEPIRDFRKLISTLLQELQPPLPYTPA